MPAPPASPPKTPVNQSPEFRQIVVVVGVPRKQFQPPHPLWVHQSIYESVGCPALVEFGSTQHTALALWDHIRGIQHRRNKGVAMGCLQSKQGSSIGLPAVGGWSKPEAAFGC